MPDSTDTLRRSVVRQESRVVVVSIGTVDVWMQQPNQRFMSAPWLEPLLRWTRQGREAPQVAATLDAMDQAGVAVGLLSAWYGPSGPLITNDEVAGLVEAHPDRFAGVASVDLNDPVAAVREVRRCVRTLGFVGVRVGPWLW